ncbi:MAG: Na+/H+ antiporter subunit E [Sedimentisphaerales bacterium]|nr:Na+/H+ antiporter subunit E [Sedimentisphaerales bacterium]
MRRVVYFIVALVVWLVLTWPFGTADSLQVILAGVGAAIIVSVMFHEVMPTEYKFLFSPVRVFWAIIYIPVFFYYILIANFDVVYRALHPKLPIKPGIVKIKTSLKTDAARVALANSITLTPGTLTVDLKDDGTMYIHWINIKSTDTEEATEYIAKKFEYFLAKIFE